MEGALRIPPNFREQLSSTSVTLDGGRYSALVRLDGGFTFNNIPPGSYVLEATSSFATFEPVRKRAYTCPLLAPFLSPPFLSHFFPTSFICALPLQVRVHVLARNNGAVQVQRLRTRELLPYPVALTAVAPIAFFTEKRSFDYMSLLKNPMVIILLVGVFMMVVMPMMIGQMSPEERAKLSKMQSEGGGFMSMIQNIQSLAEDAQQQQQPRGQIQHAAGAAGKKEKEKK